MSKIFVTSDLHIGHARILEYCPGRGNTVEEMNETIVRNWNSVVSWDDEVIICGDVIMGIVEKSIPIIRRLNGTKRLCFGNHDRKLKSLIKLPENQDLFVSAEYQYETTVKVDDKKHNIVFTHYPLMHWSGQDRGAISLSGHTHSTGEARFPSKYRQMDIGADGNGLTPYLLEDVVRVLLNRPFKPNHHNL